MRKKKKEEKKWLDLGLFDGLGCLHRLLASPISGLKTRQYSLCVRMECGDDDGDQELVAQSNLFQFRNFVWFFFFVWGG